MSTCCPPCCLQLKWRLDSRPIARRLPRCYICALAELKAAQKELAKAGSKEDVLASVHQLGTALPDLKSLADAAKRSKPLTNKSRQKLFNSEVSQFANGPRVAHSLGPCPPQNAARCTAFHVPSPSLAVLNPAVACVLLCSAAAWVIPSRPARRHTRAPGEHGHAQGGTQG